VQLDRNHSQDGREASIVGKEVQAAGGDLRAPKSIHPIQAHLYGSSGQSVLFQIHQVRSVAMLFLTSHFFEELMIVKALGVAICEHFKKLFLVLAIKCHSGLSLIRQWRKALLGIGSGRAIFASRIESTICIRSA